MRRGLVPCGLATAELCDLLRDSVVDRLQKMRLATLEALRDEIRREDEEVARLAVDGDLRAVLVGDHGPVEPELVDQHLTEGEPEGIDHRVRIVPILLGLGRPLLEPARVELVDPRGGRLSACGLADAHDVRPHPLGLGVVRRLDRLVVHQASGRRAIARWLHENRGWKSTLSQRPAAHWATRMTPPTTGRARPLWYRRRAYDSSSEKVVHAPASGCTSTTSNPASSSRW